MSSQYIIDNPCNTGYKTPNEQNKTHTNRWATRIT